MKKKGVIQLKPNAHVPHMRIWCDACKAMAKVCKRNGKPLAQCEKIHALQYRFVAFLPGTKKRIVRSLGRDYNEALKQLATLRQQLERGEVHEPEAKQQPTVPQTITDKTAPPSVADARPELLTHLFAKYLASLKGEGVPAHLKLVRSKGHISTVKTTFKHTILAVRDAGFDPKTFRLADISDDVIGKLHDLLNQEHAM